MPPRSTTRSGKYAPRKKNAAKDSSPYWRLIFIGIAAFTLLILGIEYFKTGGRLAFLRHKVEEATHTNSLTAFSPEGYDVIGLDVSHHNRAIDWKEVKKQKIAFSFIKATEGVSHQDRHFKKHWKQAKQHDVLRGAYHFFLPAKDAQLQAENFLAVVKLEAGDLPPVLDVEVTNHQSDEEIVAGVRRWLELVEEEYDLKPIIYTNYAFYERHLAGHFDEYPLWVAHYNPEKSHLIDKRNWVFWQHTDRGKLKGVKGDLDLNVFKGSLEDLYNMCYEPEAL